MRHLKFVLPALCLALAACSSLPSWLGGFEEEKPKIAGERSAVLLSDAILKPDEGLSATPITLPEPENRAEWTQKGGAASPYTGHIALALAQKPGIVTAEVGNGNAYAGTQLPEPIVAAGQVFAMDGEGVISAHRAEDISEILWKSKAARSKKNNDSLGGGLAYDSGVLYALSTAGRVVALDAKTGAERWRQELKLPLRSSPKVRDGKIYILTLDNQLFALDTASGNILWSHRGIAETAAYFIGVAPTAVAGAVLAPFSSGQMQLLRDLDGEELWEDALTPSRRTQASAIFAGIGGDLVVDGTTMIAASASPLLSAIVLPRGQRVWEQPIGTLNTPWLAGDALFVLSTNNILIALNSSDGRIRWTLPLPGFENAEKRLDPIGWRGPILAGGQVLVVSSTGLLHRVNPATGQITDTIKVPEGITTSPVVAGGRLYLMSREAELYAFY